MSGVIATIPRYQFSSATGAPLANGTLTVYVAGSTTPTNTWQDSALTIANTNPITLDSRGECVLWLDSTVSYKFILKNAAGVIQWTQDNISSVAALVSALRSDLAASSGATLVGYLPPGAGAVATTVSAREGRTVNIWDFADAAALGTSGPYAPAKDWTSAIQAAVNYATCTPANFYNPPNPTSIEFPAGVYDCYGTITFPSGAVSLDGVGGNMSFGGAIIQTKGASHPLFSINSALSLSLYFSHLLFKDGLSGGVLVPNSALIVSTGTGGSANSVYFRDCWFNQGLSTTQYACSFVAPMDDLQFIGCTFDSTSRGGLLLGSAGNNILNLLVMGCEFYASSSAGVSFINLNYVKDGLIVGNRFYSGGVMTSAITFSSANSKRVVISSNTCDGTSSFVSPLLGDYNTITGNTTNTSGLPVVITGAAITSASITNNTFVGAANASGLGIIEATGVTMSGCVIQGNILKSDGTGPGLKMSASNYTAGGNSIRGNVVQAVTSDGANGYFTFTPDIAWEGGGGSRTVSATSGSYVIANGFVVLEFVIILTAATSGTGSLIITGLPMAVGATSARGAVSMSGITYAVGSQATLVGQGGNNYLYIQCSGSGVTMAYQNALPAGASTIAGSITYAY